MKIWAHTLVKNEERYLWFAVESVIYYVDKLLLWDTGSTDSTVQIIKLLKKKHADKIDTQFLGEVTPEEFTAVRQEMLKATKSDWVIIVDGDEVWWDEEIKKTTDYIRVNKNAYETIVSSNYNVVGDIFHYQEEAAGMYRIDNAYGHINIRCMNVKIPGLNVSKPHGQQGFFDKDGMLVQDRSLKKRFHIREKTYMHFTNMIRSATSEADLRVPKRKSKLKYELGYPFPKDFFFPEVFFREKPDIVPSPWINRGRYYYVRSFFETPLRKIKRRIIKGKIGY